MYTENLSSVEKSKYMQLFSSNLVETCNVIMSCEDLLYTHYENKEATWLGLTWKKALELLELDADDVWKNVAGRKCLSHTLKDAILLIRR